ncbi:MAG: hypothetical protein HQK75_19640, partial [Candidatus Magnetomorum sp.]|nr:hypothetical protein [Candidatus Magnetomorum sp.]
DQVSSGGNTYIVNATSVATTVTLTITPETEQTGIVAITITVTDSDGMSQSSSFNLTVVMEQLIDQYTVLMLHGENNVEDTSNSEHVFINTNATFTENHENFGSSIYFDGSSKLTTPDSTDWTFGTDSFTIDFWIKTTDTQSTFLGQWFRGDDSQQSVTVGIQNSKILFVVGNGSSDFVRLENTGPTITDNNWHHIACVRNGSTFISFVDGTIVQTGTSSDTILDVTVDFWIGAMPDYDGTSLFNEFVGYLDEIHISKGIARWTTNFTPPEIPYVGNKPQISSINNQEVTENSTPVSITFTVDEFQGATPCSMGLSMSGSNQTFIPDKYLMSACHDNHYTIVATPAMNQVGSTTISITLTDASGLIANTSFHLTVTEINHNLYYWENYQAADVVLGQQDFNSNTSGLSNSKFNEPVGVGMDAKTGKVFVGDYINNRVLRFSSINAAINGSSAEAVFGQADFVSGAANRGGSVAANTFYHPEKPFVDPFGRLWVNDTVNHRVLRFDNASSKNSGCDADAVLGQPDFTTNSLGTTQNKCNAPNGVWIDPSGTLWVADKGNNRVLRFDNAAQKPNGANADGVLGQPDFTSGSTGLTQGAMNYPHDIVGDRSGTIYVSDLFNHRVLRFDNAALKSNGANADGVLGQSDFVSNVSLTTGANVVKPVGVEMDLSGRLYVSDSGNHRILLFNDAKNKANGASADNVLGQPDFTSSTGNYGGISDKSINGPQWLFFDKLNNHLWDAEYSNYRVMRYTMNMNSAPVIGIINDSIISGNSVSNQITFTVSDSDQQPLTITCQSSDNSIIQPDEIIFSGEQVVSTGSTYVVNATAAETHVTLTVTPETNQSESAFITITVTDPAGVKATTSFEVIITPYDQYTVLMLHMDDNALTDSSPQLHLVTKNGNAARNLIHSVFGEGSLSMDGSGDYLSIPDSESWTFGDENFTIDLWVNFSSTSIQQPIIGQWHTGNASWYLYYYPNRLDFYGSETGAAAQPLYVMYFSWTPTIGEWYHIAISQSGETGYLFIDGDLKTTGTRDVPIQDSSGMLEIGKNSASSLYFNGYIDEVRISKGIARWTESFSPPIYPYWAKNPPSLSSIDDKLLPENATSTTINFTATDLNAASCSLTLSITSSNTALVPNANILSSCGEDQYSIVVTPIQGQLGTTTISITITDSDGISASKSFNLTVTNNPALFDVLLMHMDDEALSDSTNNINSVQSKSGTVVRSSDTSKFGGYSAYIDSSSYLDITNSVDFNFGTDSFTIDFWVNPTLSHTDYESYIGLKNGSATPLSFRRGRDGWYDGVVFTYLEGVGNQFADRRMDLNTWYHLAFVRHNNTGILFLNGAEMDTIDLTGVTINATTVRLGYIFESFTGYIDELRVSKGVARWTENFTPPNAPYYSPQISEINLQTTIENTITSPIPFTITTGESDSFTIICTSSDSQIVNNTGINVAATGSNGLYVSNTAFSNSYLTLTVTPETDQSGSVSITVTVVDSLGLIAQESFALTVIDNPYDEHTVLMLHMDDEALSDSSIFNHSVQLFNTITRTNQESIFGGYAAYFDKENDAYLKITHSDDWDFDTELFTIDFWANWQQVEGDGPWKATLILYGFDETYTNYWNVQLFDYNYEGYQLFYHNTQGIGTITGTRYFEPVIGQWYHIAIVGESSKFVFYIDGQKLYSQERTGAFADVDYLKIGGGDSDYYFKGYLDEIRISKGIARWTENFTPPTLPYGPVSSPEILPELSHTIPANATNSIISFTATDSDSDPCSISLTMTSSNLSLIANDQLIASCHEDQYTFAVTPSENQIGTAVISITITDNDGLTACTALNITVTNNPYAFDVLLMHMDDESLSDATNNVNTVQSKSGTVVRSSNTSKFGGYSAYIDTSSYLDMANSVDFNFGTDSFTIDFWVNPTLSHTDYESYIGLKNGSATPLSFRRGRDGWYDGVVFTYLEGVGNQFADRRMDLNTWYHIAFVRHNNTAILFLNGVEMDTIDLTGVPINATSVRLGYIFESFQGY